MQIIHKYILGSDNIIEMPKNAKILKIDKYLNENCLWAIVDYSSDHTVEERCFMPYITGWQIHNSANLEYINTVSHDGLVWHWFELKK